MKAAKNQKTVIAYKALDKDFRCRNFQFSVGETYNLDGEIKRCKRGFHSCENPLDIFTYYVPAGNRYAVVEASGQIDREESGDTKIASASIYIKAEISLPDLVAAAIKWITSKCDPVKAKHSTGYQSASSSTGDRSASSSTGYQSASSSTGDQSASSSTGYQSASSSTGDQSASSSTGDRSASSSTGKNAVAINIGIQGRAKAGRGGAIVLCNHDANYNIRYIRASKVGENGVKPDVFYVLNNAGEFEEQP